MNGAKLSPAYLSFSPLLDPHNDEGPTSDVSSESEFLGHSDSIKNGLSGDAADGPRQRTIKSIKIQLENACSESLSLRKTAVEQLRGLSKNVDNRQAIVSLGGVKPLLQFLISNEEDVAELAMLALYNLSLDRNNKQTMPSEGVIDALIKAMVTGPQKVKETAAGALCALSDDDANILKLGAAGAVEPLTALLQNGSDQAKGDVCRALFNLSLLEVNSRMIVARGAIGPLLHLLQQRRPGIRTEKIVKLLASLAVTKEGRHAIATEAEGISALAECLEGDSIKEKEHAAAALWLLAVNSPAHQALIRKEAIIPSLVVLSKSSSETPRARRKAELLLGLLRPKTSDHSD
eukprot:jgi/Mesen1/5600/ME000282S04750